jgi:hypothetical protein
MQHKINATIGVASSVFSDRKTSPSRGLAGELFELLPTQTLNGFRCRTSIG